MDVPPIIKTLELDKICRVCLNIKKEMRPLFGELMADMLMDCTQIQVHTALLVFAESSLSYYFLFSWRWTIRMDGQIKFAYNVFIKLVDVMRLNLASLSPTHNFVSTLRVWQWLWRNRCKKSVCTTRPCTPTIVLRRHYSRQLPWPNSLIDKCRLVQLIQIDYIVVVF